MSDSNGVSISGDAHSRAELRDAVRDMLPAAELRDVRAVERGKNAVYVVTLSDGEESRELVLKVGTYHFPEGCRAEPFVLDRIASRTEIPVPEVVGLGELADAPCFLAERVPGETFECDPEALAPETFERVCVEAGRNLGELHAALPADDWGLLGVEAGHQSLEFVRTFDDWPTYFEAWASHNVERLEGTRFSDLTPALDSRVADAAAELREYGPFDPVVTHYDYRLGNLLLNRDASNRPVTNAVIDWATPTAATAESELAVTDALLVDWPAFGPDRKRHLRERLYEGYQETNDLERDAGFEVRRRVYDFAARLRLMVNLDEEMAGRPETAVEARAREHRDALARFGAE
ncbi:phosphotransferase family protein [Halorussus amylolyticus]|uniref:phosphotransferase family protein n=1 Tax=Halorussus amylolyticus TaxID=1126242 RepID=UPI0010529828|nr:phosphotransferase [Halorussus amylolyticus]